MAVSASSSPHRTDRPNEDQNEALRQQQELLLGGAVTRSLLDKIPQPLLIINRAWRVVYANRAVWSLPTLNKRPDLVGFRAGEAFHCIHARLSPEESPQAETCRLCGVARAVAGALEGTESVSDCRLSCELGGEKGLLDLRVSAAPLDVDGERFSILTLSDISEEKRRSLLESVCFHDLLNSLTSVQGFLDVLKHTDVSDSREICHSLEQTTRNSIDEIVSLRLLGEAERSTLQVAWEAVDGNDFLDRTLQCLGGHPAAEGKRLKCLCREEGLELTSDPGLLRRVVANMIINALEATPPGGEVTVGCRREEGMALFWVHNEGQLPLEARERIFQRPFSTKGEGRGLGSYSIKLLCAALGGRASFTSDTEEGTVFRACFPISPARHA